MTEEPPPEQDRVYIDKAAEILDRRIKTLRAWDTEGTLPPHLKPARGLRKRRYWTQAQIEQIIAWIHETDRRPGKALKAYQHGEPDADSVTKRIHAMRGPRKRESANGD